MRSEVQKVIIVTRLLISRSNHCIAVDAISFKLYDVRTFSCPGFTTIKSHHLNCYWHMIYEFDLTPDINVLNRSGCKS